MERWRASAPSGTGGAGVGVTCPPAQEQGCEMNSVVDGAKKHHVCTSQAWSSGGCSTAEAQGPVRGSERL